MDKSKIENLRISLICLLEVKKSRSQSWLAKQTGVAQKTLNRFLRSEVTSINPKSLVVLAKFCLGDTNKGILAKEQVKNLKELLRLLEEGEEQGEDTQNEKIQRFLTENNDWCLLVYLLSCNKHGLSQKTLFALGVDARIELDKLLAKKWVLEKDQYYHSANKEFSVTKKVLLQRISRVFIERVHPDWWNQQGMPPNFLYFYSEGLNEKAMARVTQIMADASKQIEEVLTSAESLGKLPVSILLLNDCLTA
jgi:hypothetical protein